MFAKILIATGVVATCACIQRWSLKRRDQVLLEKVDVPRWEDEGGAPSPDARVDTPDPGADRN